LRTDTDPLADFEVLDVGSDFSDGTDDFVACYHEFGREGTPAARDGMVVLSVSWTLLLFSPFFPS